MVGSIRSAVVVVIVIFTGLLGVSGLIFVSNVSDERVCETGRGLTCAVNIRIKGMQLRKDPGANACAPEFYLKKLTFGKVCPVSVK